MTTAVTATVCDMTSDAGFRNWVQEIITMLFTTLGVTQTADTGQINTSTVTRPAAANTSAGYVIGSFNDAHQTASPVFFKLEFGTGNTATTSVQLWITVGTGSNGAGTLSGVVGTRVSCGGGTPYSNVTSYTTRACYSATAGVLWLAWKQGLYNTSYETGAGFMISRSADSTGASTTDAVMLYTNSSTVSTSSNYGAVQAISFLTSTAYNSSAPWNGTASNQWWGVWPFSLTSTLYNGNCQLGPVFQFTPVVGICPWLALGLQTELAIGSTCSTTLVGSTAHTYIAIGSGPFGSVTTLTYNGWPASSLQLVALWE